MQYNKSKIYRIVATWIGDMAGRRAEGDHNHVDGQTLVSMSQCPCHATSPCALRSSPMPTAPPSTMPLPSGLDLSPRQKKQNARVRSLYIPGQAFSPTSSLSSSQRHHLSQVPGPMVSDNFSRIGLGLLHYYWFLICHQISINNPFKFF